MKIFNKILVGVLMAMGCGSVYADTTLPARLEAYQPDVLLKRLVYESDIDQMVKQGDWGQNKKPASYKHWIAYSDRNNNVTYTDPSKSTPFSKLNFNEKVIIAKIQNGYALVYTDPKYPEWPAHSERAVSRGWVPMSNLLLWQSCPVDNKGIYQKALLAANIENKSNADLGKSFKNPVEKSDAKRIKTDMTFYYVMKTDPVSKLKLLASQSRMDGNTDEVLYGWVDVNSFVPWNQRSCLEPNWKPSDVAYFNSPVGKSYPIYPDMQMKQAPATQYRYGVVNKDDKKKSSQFRMHPYQTRFPILDQDPATANPNIYKCTTFGYAGRSVINPDQGGGRGEEEAIKKLVESLNKLKHINIIFVIDGTRSMHPYFESVKNAINRGIQYFDPSKFTLRVGAVIYRDYADGQYLTEKVPLTKPNSPQLMSFLNNIGQYGAKSADADRTNTEALYKGLEVATDASGMGFNKDESTIIVVVGDCGNDPNDTQCMTSEQIIDRIAANNIQLVSFQVDSRDAVDWTLFVEQMARITSGGLRKQYLRIRPNGKPRFKPLKTGYDFSSNDSLDFYIGSIRFAEVKGQKLSPGVLAGLIENNIGAFSASVQEKIDILIKQTQAGETTFEVNDGNNEGVTVEESFLIDRIGRELYEDLKKSRAAVTFTGYAPKKSPDNRDYWKPVAFMSSEEFAGLMSRLEKLYNNSRVEGDRKPYVDAVKSLIRVMVPDITEKEMDEMGIDQVMRLAAGLNESSDAVKGRSLEEIQNPQVVSNVEYQTLINTFISKYENLKNNVQDKNYPYSFETPNGQKFYWIPVDDLP